MVDGHDLSEVGHTVLPDPRVTPTVTVTAVARLLGISRSAAYSAATRGEIPTLRIGNRILVPTSAIYELLHLPLPTEGVKDR